MPGRGPERRALSIRDHAHAALMPLTELQVRGCRIIEHADLQFSPDCNLVTGVNGAGKTTLLEAVNFLATGRSHLTGKARTLIAHEAERMSVFGRVCARAGARAVSLGMMLARNGDRSCRVEGVNQRNVVASARALPVFLFEPNSHLLVSGGPGERRRFLDRGLFHVEHDYQALFGRYRRALDQRNALLRARGRGEDLEPWEAVMDESGLKIDALRTGYLEELETHLRVLEPGFEDLGRLALRYQPGSSGERPLRDELRAHRDRDRQLGHTTDGPHRADLVIRAQDRAVRGTASRGQVKRLCALLLLAQLVHFQARTQNPGVLLVDDFGSELDADTQSRVFEIIRDCGAQVIANTLDPEQIRHWLRPSDRVFHVEHGRFQAVL